MPIRTTGYVIPKGKVQTPYIYVFDATQLADGGNFDQLSLRVRGDSDFLLRSIVGIPSVTVSGFNLYTAGLATVFSNPVITSAVANSNGNRWVIGPELLYPANSDFKIDLLNVARTFNTDGVQNVFTSYIYFQGVRMYNADRGWTPDSYPTTYKYVEREFSYSFPLLVNFRATTAGANGSPATEARTFVQPVRNYEFELHEIRVTNASDGTPLTTNDFQILLFDPTGQSQLSDVPVNINAINAKSGNGFESVFPVPPMVYPIDGRIKFQIQSLIPFADATFPRNYNVQFVGVERIPC